MTEQPDVDRPNPGKGHQAPATWSAPQRKVTAAGVGGAFTTLTLWVLGLTGLEASPGVAAAIATVLCFAAGYLVPSGD